MLEYKTVTPPAMSPEQLKNWAAERSAGVQVSRFGIGVDSIEWRDYHNQWHKRYWDQMWKRDSTLYLLRELNLKQAARIMELEHELRMLKKSDLKSKYVRDT